MALDVKVGTVSGARVSMASGVKLNMASDVTVNGHRAKVLTIDQYMENWRDQNAIQMRGLNKVQRRMRHYSRYNYDRQRGIEISHEMSAVFRKAVLALDGPQSWFFITDDWCIDSAYSLPLILNAATLHESIEFHILLRDTNLEILDDYLTDGLPSIPIFTGFNEDGRQLFRWGPHPEKLHRLRTTLQDAGESGRVVASSTIDWYADNGHLEVERELAVLFSKISDCGG